MPNPARDHGFSITELLVSMTVMLIVIAGALTTFKSALDINQAAGQMADSSQNLRAGTNQLVRDLMMAGRIIAGGSVPAPNGSGATPIARPGPPGTTLTFTFMADDDGTLSLPSITTGYQLGPVINGSATDIVTILSVDEFTEVIQGLGAGTPTGLQGVIATDAASVTLPAASPWLVGDATEDTTAMVVGDLVLFKNENGMAVQTVTSKDATHLYFAQNSAADWFHFNQRNTSYRGTVFCIKDLAADPQQRGCDKMPVTTALVNEPFTATSLFRLTMTTYYVDNTPDPKTLISVPRLTRIVNHFDPPQVLAGVVDDLDLTYDVVDPLLNDVSSQPSLPFTQGLIVYTSSMIKKVNIHVGVRSEAKSGAIQDYIRTQISTSVDVRSLASVDRYDTSN